MRITGGRLGGRRIKAPPGSATRPTSDRVRESVFAILGRPPDSAAVLDVFAGSGALGLEALSRGARRAVFIDNAAAALRCVRDNIATLGLQADCRVIRGDAARLVSRWAAMKISDFSWVFLDPPYRGELAERLLAALGGGELLSAEATVVVEHDRRNRPEQSYGCLVRTDHRRYGDTEVSFYRRAPRREGNLTMSQTTSDDNQPTSIAIYPGTFDPITNGHLDILERSLRLFDQVIVAIATNPRKKPLFSVEERVQFIKDAVGDQVEHLSFDSFEGLLVSYCQRRGATCIVRGLRALADFEYEFQFAHMNRRLAPSVDTIFFMTDERNHYVSSSLVKEVASFGGDVSGLVPPVVDAALAARYASPKGDSSS